MLAVEPVERRRASGLKAGRLGQIVDSERLLALDPASDGAKRSVHFELWTSRATSTNLSMFALRAPQRSREQLRSQGWVGFHT